MVEHLVMEAETQKMIQILCTGDYAEDCVLANLSDKELIEEGVSQGLWKRISQNVQKKKGCGKVICADTDYDGKMVICGEYGDILCNTCSVHNAKGDENA